MIMVSIHYLFVLNKSSEFYATFDKILDFYTL